MKYGVVYRPVPAAVEDATGSLFLSDLFVSAVLPASDALSDVPDVPDSPALESVLELSPAPVFAFADPFFRLSLT
jgi:hypothetical protein